MSMAALLCLIALILLAPANTTNEHVYDRFGVALFRGAANGTLSDEQIVIFMGTCTVRDDHEMGCRQMAIVVLAKGCDVHDYNSIVVCHSMLRPFTIQRLPPNNQFALEQTERSTIKDKIQKIQEITLETNKLRFRGSKTPMAFVNLILAKICYKFGLNGYYYAYNTLLASSAFVNKTQSLSFFENFHQKYLRYRDRAVGNAPSCILVIVKILKNQSDSDLQIRAQCLSNSFGQIIPQVSVRHNSRDQIEYPVQSLMNPSMKLRIRPKYLRRIGNIYIYPLYQCSLGVYHNLMYELLTNPSNEVLYLPHLRNADQFIVAPRNVHSFMMFQLQNRRKYDNLIFDMVISSFIMVGSVAKTVADVFTSIENLPFDIDKRIWQQAIETMKRTSHIDDRRIEKALLKANTEVFNRHHEQWLKVRLDKEQNFDSLRHKMMKGCRERVQEKLGKSIRQHTNFYLKLLQVIKHEISQMIREQHPDYYEQYSRSNETKVVGHLRKLYQISIFHNYLKANAKGHDLHVFSYDHLSNERGLLWNLESALTEKLNVEWNIKNLDTARVLVNNVMKLSGLNCSDCVF